MRPGLRARHPRLGEGTTLPEGTGTPPGYVRVNFDGRGEFSVLTSDLEFLPTLEPDCPQCSTPSFSDGVYFTEDSPDGQWLEGYVHRECWEELQRIWASKKEINHP